MLVVCPLEFERSALAATARRRGWRLERVGLGRGAVESWAACARAEPGETVVLAGIAGGLDPRMPVGTAAWASWIDDGAGGRWEPPLLPPGPAVGLVTADAVAATPQEKQLWRVRTGAALVDMEAAAFAAAAQRRGWRWAVVRGVSDGSEDALDPAIAAWTGRDGRVRPGAVAAGLLRSPGLVPQALRLARRGAEAMRAVESLLISLDEATRGGAGATMPTLEPRT